MSYSAWGETSYGESTPRSAYGNGQYPTQYAASGGYAPSQDGEEYPEYYLDRSGKHRNKDKDGHATRKHDHRHAEKTKDHIPVEEKSYGSKSPVSAMPVSPPVWQGEVSMRPKMTAPSMGSGQLPTTERDSLEELFAEGNARFDEQDYGNKKLPWGEVGALLPPQAAKVIQEAEDVQSKKVGKLTLERLKKAGIRLSDSVVKRVHKSQSTPVPPDDSHKSPKDSEKSSQREHKKKSKQRSGFFHIG